MRSSKPHQRVRVFLLVLSALSPWLACGSVAAEIDQRWAVLVGVNEYTNLQDLRYCVADARSLRDRLVAAGFPKENVFLLVDGAARQVDQPFLANIQQRIASVLAVAGKGDLVLIAFSGHGVHLDGTSYFCSAEANLVAPQNTMLPLDAIYKQMEASQARQKVLLVDACRNDPRPPGKRNAAAHQLSLQGFAERLEALPEGILALSSSAAGQFSWEDEKLGHGVFMHYVMEGLSGKADANGDKKVSLLELYNYANLQTKRWILNNRPDYKQTPELFGKITGDFEFGRQIAPPPSAVAPFTAAAAKAHQEAWATYLIRPVELTDSIGMQFRLVPPGQFTMGSTESPPSQDERPHRVHITRPFYVSKHETTVGQFAKFVAATQHRTTMERNDTGSNRGWNSATRRFEEKPGFSWRNPGWNQEEDHPVVNVSWNDAQRPSNCWLVK